MRDTDRIIELIRPVLPDGVFLVAPTHGDRCWRIHHGGKQMEITVRTEAHGSFEYAVRNIDGYPPGRGTASSLAVALEQALRALGALPSRRSHAHGRVS